MDSTSIISSFSVGCKTNGYGSSHKFGLCGQSNLLKSLISNTGVIEVDKEMKIHYMSL